MSGEWYDDHNQIAAVVQWMFDEGYITTVPEAVHVIDEPWKYEDERALMLAPEVPA